MEHLKNYLWLFITAQVASLFLLWAAYTSPRFARVLFFLLFGWASYINLRTGIRTPEVYLAYAPMALSVYADFINGWFRDHVTLMVSCIATGQATIALGMLLKGVWVKIACMGGIAFLIAIAPLGIGAGFPFSIVVSLALYFVLRRAPDPDYIWNAPKKASYQS